MTPIVDLFISLEDGFSLFRPGSPRVPVHGSASSDDCFVPAELAISESVRNSRTERFCCRQLSTTVSIRSTNRLPASLCVPNYRFRQITAYRSKHSAELFVGSI